MTTKMTLKAAIERALLAMENGKAGYVGKVNEEANAEAHAMLNRLAHLQTEDVVSSLAKTFINRAKTIGLKGKARDAAALEFFLGAMALSEMQGNEELTNRLSIIAVIVIATRGYAELEKLYPQPIKGKVGEAVPA